MSRPIRTTVIFGLISTLLIVPAAGLLTRHWGWPAAHKLILWADLALYTLLMVRWSKSRLAPALFPLAILLGAALWPWSYSGFFLLGLGIFSWIRSGICFKAPPLRLITAEIVTVGGGAALVAVMGPISTLSSALTPWLFFLVQALYFFLVPGLAGSTDDTRQPDPFEAAVQEADKLLA